MTPTFAPPPEKGQLVQVRSRPWVVNGVKAVRLPTPAMKLPLAAPQHLITLSSVEDDGMGEELQVVWEIEPGAKVVEKVALPEPSGFDAPETLDAFLDQRENLAISRDGMSVLNCSQAIGTFMFP